MKRLLLVFLLTASLVSGCGFQLRGTIDLPDSIRSVKITSPDLKLKDVLADSLESNNVSVIDSADSLSAHVMIEKADIVREVTTIDPRGKATGYNLILRTKYRVVDSKGSDLIKPSKATARRDYNFDADQLLSATREEELLHDEMREEVAQSILRKMSRIR
jgi:LPS-assembly lipoprotein